LREYRALLGETVAAICSATLSKYKDYLKEYRALLRKCTAFWEEYRAFWRETVGAICSATFSKWRALLEK